MYIRFILYIGGCNFPPKVYFKIFTHRAVCDVGAFAPRDYTQESPIEAAQRHNKSGATLPSLTNIRVGSKYFGAIVSTNATSGCDGWYHRRENNAWRPIASEAFDDLVTPPWMREKPHAKAPALFHFSRLQRKEDLLKYRKKRRREWMAKAYLLANPMANVVEDAFQNLDISSNEFNWDEIGGPKSFEKYSKSAPFYSDAPGGMKHTGAIGVDVAMSDEDVLKWSMALDFDDYAKDWLAAATSLPSDVTFSSIYQASTSMTAPFAKQNNQSNSIGTRNKSSFASSFDGSGSKSSFSLPKLV